MRAIGCRRSAHVARRRADISCTWGPVRLQTCCVLGALVLEIGGDDEAGEFARGLVREDACFRRRARQQRMIGVGLDETFPGQTREVDRLTSGNGYVIASVDERAEIVATRI